MKPKIMLFSHICNAIYITGAEKLLLFFVQEIIPQYHCVIVVPNEGALSQQARALGAEIIILPCPLLYLIYQPTDYIKAELELLKQKDAWGHLLYLLRTINPDIVMTNTCVHALPVVAAKSLGIPTIWQITETMEQNEWTHLSVEIIHQNADVILGISEATVRSFVGEDVRRKITILPPSWRMEELQPEEWGHNRISKRRQLRIQESSMLIGYISSYIYPSKGLYHFIKMALQICEEYSFTEYVIIGKPKDEAYFQKCISLIQNSRHFHRFHFIRFEANIQAVYPAMDIVVVPALSSEGFGMTALEGLIFGKPVIAYRSGGLREILQATDNSEYLVDVGDIDGLAACVRNLLSHPFKVHQVGSRNHLHVQAAFGIDKYRMDLQNMMAQPVLHVKKGPEASAVRAAKKMSRGQRTKTSAKGKKRRRVIRVKRKRSSRRSKSSRRR